MNGYRVIALTMYNYQNIIPQMIFFVNTFFAVLLLIYQLLF